MKIYLNLKSAQGRETVDEVDRGDFPDRHSFAQEVNRLICEYVLCGMDVYKSSRMCANWKE